MAWRPITTEIELIPSTPSHLKSGCSWGCSRGHRGHDRAPFIRRCPGRWTAVLAEVAAPEGKHGGIPHRHKHKHPLTPTHNPSSDHTCSFEISVPVRCTIVLRCIKTAMQWLKLQPLKLPGDGQSPFIVSGPWQLKSRGLSMEKTEHGRP